MFEIEKLKQQVYKQVQQNGLFKQVQAQLKTQVLATLESQPSSKQSALQFSYQHPLLNKLQKYNLTHICLDLIQEFLESFKFQYTLSVFMKELNRSGKINRDKLAKQVNLQSTQAVLLTAVEVLKNGQVMKKKQSGFMKVSQQKNQNQKKEEKPVKVQEKKTSSKANNQKNIQNEQKDNKKQKIPDKEQKHALSTVSPSPSPPPHTKVKKQQPKTAADFLGSFISKHQPKQQEQKKYPYERAQSAPAAPIKMAPPPPETGANKIRGGITSNKPSPISALLKGTSIGATKDPYSYDLKSKQAPSFRKKSQQDIDEQIDQFQQSRDSTRRNPLYSSTQEGLQSMGYDQSVDSVAIQEYDHYEIAKKKKR